jgi:hypothetical protein
MERACARLRARASCGSGADGGRTPIVERVVGCSPAQPCKLVAGNHSYGRVPGRLPSDQRGPGKPGAGADRVTSMAVPLSLWPLMPSGQYHLKGENRHSARSAHSAHASCSELKATKRKRVLPQTQLSRNVCEDLRNGRPSRMLSFSPDAIRPLSFLVWLLARGKRGVRAEPSLLKADSRKHKNPWSPRRPGVFRFCL